MELYEVRQSENGVGKAYTMLMDKLSEHVTLLARNGKPITSIMGIKRVLYRYRKDLCVGATPLPAASPHMVRTVSVLNEDLGLLVSDVLHKFNVDVLDAVQVGLLGEREMKRVLIKYDYGQMAKQGLKYKEIKKILSEQYGVSVSSIEKLVYGK